MSEQKILVSHKFPPAISAAFELLSYCLEVERGQMGCDHDATGAGTPMQVGHRALDANETGAKSEALTLLAEYFNQSQSQMKGEGQMLLAMRDSMKEQVKRENTPHGGEGESLAGQIAVTGPKDFRDAVLPKINEILHQMQMEGEIELPGE